jgi:hypothetical protein
MDESLNFTPESELLIAPVSHMISVADLNQVRGVPLDVCPRGGATWGELLSRVRLGV